MRPVWTSVTAMLCVNSGIFTIKQEITYNIRIMLWTLLGRNRQSFNTESPSKFYAWSLSIIFSVIEYVFTITFNRSVKLYGVTFIAVLQAQESCCNSSSDKLIVEAGHGYLSNSVIAETGCGSSSCPWHIHVPGGQKIDIILWDFQYGTLHQCTFVIVEICLLWYGLHS